MSVFIIIMSFVFNNRYIAPRSGQILFFFTLKYKPSPSPSPLPSQNKKIAFQCTWCYSSDFFEDTPHSKPHSIIGVCKDAFENPKYHDFDFLVKIDNDDKWHTLFVRFNNSKSQPKFNIRIYNYTEGILIKKLEMLKNMEKFNI